MTIYLKSYLKNMVKNRSKNISSISISLDEQAVAKELLKERLRNKINTNRVTISDGKALYSMTENELREMVSEAIRRVEKKVKNG